jgi:hypothetical protein
MLQGLIEVYGSIAFSLTDPRSAPIGPMQAEGRILSVASTTITIHTAKAFAQCRNDADQTIGAA